MEYLERLKEELVKNGYGKRYIKVCYNYAKTLLENNSPVIFDNIHLSLLLGVNYRVLGYYISNSDKFYKEKQISKRSNGVRIISMPSYNLKKLQKWILENILYKIPTSEVATGFVKEKSILDNASPHTNKKYVINLDIKDFFPSIKFKTIFYLFLNLGYTKEVSYSLSKIVTYKGCLPQGSPTSPYLSNLVMKGFDRKLKKLTDKYNSTYTRYADDITISGNENVVYLIKTIKSFLNKEGFTLNEDKIKIQSRNGRQEVTNLIVNNSVKVKLEFKKKLRQQIYFCKKYGVYNHLKYIKCEEKSFFREYLYGHANFIYMIEPEIGKKFLKDLDEINWNS